MSKPQKEPRSAWKNRIVGTGLVDATELLANPRNWRLHPDNQRAALDKVLDMVGWVQNVIVNRRTGFVIDGHLRADMAISKGEKVPVQYVDLSPEEESLILATFDRLTAMAGVDSEKLSDLVEEASEAFPDIEEILLGMDDLIESEESGRLTDDDAVPEPQAEVITTLGDCWRLGAHRLVCGDSTKESDVQVLMNGVGASLCFTSPPYGQQRNYKSQVADWNSLMCGAFSVLPVVDSAQVLVNLGMIHRDGEWVPYWDQWIEFMRSAGWRAFGWYVWDQGPGLPGDWNGRLAPSHEFVFHFNRIAEKARKTVDCKWAGESNHGKGLRAKDGSVTEYSHAGEAVQSVKIADSVFRVMRHKARGIEVEHPAVFPVELAVQVIESFSDAGDICYEPFAGSGSQLIAGEKCGRSIYGMEIAPVYVDLCVRRWQDYTGKSATLDGTEQTFDEIAADRQPVAV